MSRPANKPLRVALVHDWLTGMRGGEKVLVELCSLLPKADLFTLVNIPDRCEAITAGRHVTASFLNRLPGIRHTYRHLLPLMPRAIGRLDVSDYDLVISSSHCVAKGIGGQRPDQPHVCYCHTPMRYIWAVGADYRRHMGLTGLAMQACQPFLRKWDRRSADNVNLFLANSSYIADRITAAYGRKAQVLHPPINVNFFTPADITREDFYLIVSALTPYKKIDHAVAAFAKLGRPLMVIGEGPLRKRLQSTAPDNVQFLGWRSDEEVRDHYRRCRALIFPQQEDFGMVPLEAMACGTPVIAYGSGGAMETVRDATKATVPDPTGLLYRPQTSEALADAVEQFDLLINRCEPQNLRRWAEQFSSHRFREGFKQAVSPLLKQYGLEAPWE